MLLRALNGFMALLFLFAAAVQYNDPDPLQWMAIYAAAAVLSGLAAWRITIFPWLAPALVGLIALLWAASIAPRALGKVPLSEMFRSWEMKSPVVEENREMFGLLIVTAWMVVLTLARRRAT